MIDWYDVTTWKVLVVDDEVDNLEVVSETLEYYGVRVWIAENGRQALARLAEATPNLIITDLSMPIMDGWKLLSSIKTNPALKTIPLLALSAHAMVGDKERALSAGFDGYMTKPLNIVTLLDDIRAAAQEIIDTL